MAGGFLRGGMIPKSSSGSGRGRSAFMSNSSSNLPTPPHMPPPHSGADKPEHMGSGSETKIVHHPDGSHEVHHSDGDTTKHPSAGHMAAHLHAKHAGGGNVGNMQCDEGKCTTHHVGPDGEVSGPTEHGVPQEGADHLANMMSGGMDTEGSSEPDGDEYGAGFAG